jgi:ribosomal protein L40E
MEEGKKKIIKIVVVVACLVAAGIITYATRSGSSSSSGIDSIERGEMIWLKCRNPKCENEWQLDKKDYLVYLKEHTTPGMMTAPPVVCPKCSEESGYRAEKCEKCGLVFERGTVPHDFADRCPKCGYSKAESLHKEAIGEAGGETAGGEGGGGKEE